MPMNADSTLRLAQNVNSYLRNHLFSLRLLMIIFGVLASVNLGYLCFSGRKLGRDTKLFVVRSDEDLLKELSIHERVKWPNKLHKKKISSRSELRTKGNAPVTEHTESGPTIPHLCPKIPPHLGPVTFENTFDLDFRKEHISDLRPGGSYKSRKCTARQTAAIIVPFSGTKLELLAFVNYMHPFLMKQQLEYQLFVVENNEKSMPFSAGRLLNIGYQEALRTSKSWLCIILHSSHILPVDTRNLYRCLWHPMQHVSKLKVNGTLHKYPSSSLGVVTIPPLLYRKVNGFPNKLGDDSEVYPEFVKRSTNSSQPTAKSSNVTDTSLNEDGLTTLHYQLSFTGHYRMHTHIVVSKFWLTKSNKSVLSVVEQYLGIPDGLSKS